MALINCSCGGWYPRSPEQKNVMQQLIDGHNKRGQALVHAKTKLQAYRHAHGDLLHGVEFTQLIDLIDEAMK